MYALQSLLHGEEARISETATQPRLVVVCHDTKHSCKAATVKLLQMADKSNGHTHAINPPPRLLDEQNIKILKDKINQDRKCISNWPFRILNSLPPTQ